MSRGLLPSGTKSLVFYEVWRLQEVQALTALRPRVGPLKEPWSSKLGDPGVRGLESLEARSDECLEDRGPGRLNLSYFTRSGGSWEVQIPPRYDSGWVRLKKPKTGSSDLRIFGSDECLEDRGPGRLHLSYFTRFGGSRTSRF